jgi:hypothetical protein
MNVPVIASQLSSARVASGQLSGRTRQKNSSLHE